MCNCRLNKSAILSLIALANLSLIITSLSNPAWAEESGTASTLILSVGAREFSVAETRALFEQARVLASLKSGRVLTLTELKGVANRRRVLQEHIKSLELLSFEPGVPSTHQVNRYATEILTGRRLTEQMSLEPGVETDPTAVDQLAALLRASRDDVQLAIELHFKKLRLGNRLLSQLPESYMLITWFERKLTATFEGLAIPRVPTSAEIDKAVQRLRAEISARYADNFGRFNKPPKILANRIRVLWARTRTEATDRETRQKANLLRDEYSRGVALNALLERAGDPRGIRSGGHVTLRAARYPALISLQKGEYSALMEDEDGVSFYIVKTHAPAFERPLNDPTVQRELAAEILRERDTLPHAKGLAYEVADKWRSRPRDGEYLAQSIRGARTLAPAEISPFTQQQIPGIGSSAAALEALQQLREGEVSSEPVQVRQDYILFRLLNWDTPSLADWWIDGPTFWTEYEVQAKRHLIEQWIAQKVPLESISIDNQALSLLEL